MRIKCAVGETVSRPPPDRELRPRSVSGLCARVGPGHNLSHSNCRTGLLNSLYDNLHLALFYKINNAAQQDSLASGYTSL